MPKHFRQHALSSTVVIFATAFSLTARAEFSVLYGGRDDRAGLPVTQFEPGYLDALPGHGGLTTQSMLQNTDRIYGGVRLSEGFALEAQQTRQFGDASRVAEETVGLVGKARFPLSESLSFVGSAGFQYPQGVGSPGEPMGANPLYGVGLQLDAGKGWELRAESEHVITRAGEPRNLGGDILLFGARRRF